MLKAAIVATVNYSARRPWLVLALTLILTAGASVYVARHFAINTDISKLISDKLPWRQREIAFNKAFPKQDATILVVLDAPTPELAEDAATKLTQKLAQRPDNIRGAKNVSGSDFFKRNGLLYLDDAELKSTLEQISNSAPVFGPIVNEPNLKGIMDSLSLMLRAVRFGKANLDQLAPVLNGMSTTIEDIAQGKQGFFSWKDLLGESNSEAASQRRQIVEVRPILDYNALQPGEEATTAIRQIIADLKIPESGVTARLTGQVTISDEEFATLEKGAALNGTITVLAVLVILWLALHSLRIILAVFLSLMAGLAVTAAFGLAAVHAFNPISIAFFVLFVGIGVDFGLQFSVSYRAARYEREDLFGALVATARGTGGRLALAAMATAAGFLSFLPTAYRGLSELGLIAGAGMLIAFFSSITVLPALLRLLNPPAEPDPLGYASLAPVDRFLERNRKNVIVGTLGAVLLASPLLYWLRFDTNPMNLRSPNVESVATYLDLRKNPETRGGTAEVLAPSLNEADAIAKKVSTLPEVGRTLTLSSFVPDKEKQTTSLEAIRQTATTVESLLTPSGPHPAPSEEDLANGIGDVSGLLTSLSGSRDTPGAKSARRLSEALSKLSKAELSVRSKVEAALIMPFRVTLDDLKQSLHPQRVSLEQLPQELREDWETRSGRSRVSISPKGDTNDNATLRQFVTVVTAAIPEATGEPVGVVNAGDAILHAFEQAAALALLSIAILLWITLGRFTDVLLTLIPLLLAGLVTLELCVVFNLPLNFANIIALPLLLGVGVAFKIYYVMAWREGRSNLLESPLTRAVFFSGLTTAVAFGSLWLSNHPGTSSMGELLALSLVSTMAAAVLFQPLLMGPPRKEAAPATSPQPSRKSVEALQPTYPPKPVPASNLRRHKIFHRARSPRS